MTSRAIAIALWGIAFVALVGAGTVWRRTLRGQAAAAATVWPAPTPGEQPSVDSLAVLTSRIIDRDAFRLDRKPAAIPYRVAGDSAITSAPTPPSVPKPALALVGIVGGPPWAALVNGIPAHDGTVLVHAADTLSGLRIRAVSSGGVTITGLDTVWHLTTKQN